LAVKLDSTPPERRRWRRRSAREYIGLYNGTVSTGLKANLLDLIIGKEQI